MKTYKVYELINSMGTVEYVGETTLSHTRLRQHTRCVNGKFYGRQDLIMNIVAEFDNRVDARTLEGQLKLQYRLEWTERNGNGGKVQRDSGNLQRISSLGAKASGLKQAKVHHICPYCQKEGTGFTMKRWHYENCKQKVVNN